MCVKRSSTCARESTGGFGQASHCHRLIQGETGGGKLPPPPGKKAVKATSRKPNPTRSRAGAQRCPQTQELMGTFEELNRALVLFGGGARAKCAEMFSFSGFGVP